MSGHIDITGWIANIASREVLTERIKKVHIISWDGIENGIDFSWWYLGYSHFSFEVVNCSEEYFNYLINQRYLTPAVKDIYKASDFYKVIKGKNELGTGEAGNGCIILKKHCKMFKL